MSLTTICSLNVPDNEDSVDIETNIGDFVTSMDSICAPRFDTVANRDLSIPIPITGQICYTAETDEMYIYRTSKWVSLVPRLIFKTVAQKRRSSTSFVNDTELFAAVEANSQYNCEIILRYLGGASDIKVRVTGVNDAEGVYVAGLTTSASSITSGTLCDGLTDLTSGRSFGSLSTSNMLGVRIKAILNTTSAGIVRVQWGQDSSSSTDLTVDTGSSLELFKV